MSVTVGGKRLRVTRKFTAQMATTKGVLHPFDAINWEKRNSVIQGTGGVVVFEMKGVEVPADWSQLATDIVVSKYFRKAGVPNDGAESSVRQVVGRVSRAVRLSGDRQEYFASDADAEIFEHELAYLLVTQRAAFNSPVWFNCGLAEAYDIRGEPAGNCAWDKHDDKIKPVTDSYTRPQLSACFIQKIEDDLMDIAEHVKREMRIFKYGSGAGANFSTLRGKGEKLSNGGESSGVMSFLEIFDRAAGAIKSGGTTRRAAKMVVIDADHPDIEEFVEWKVVEEEKARALIAAGYSSDIDGAAFKTVGGQNANNSVRVTDGFMDAALCDGPWSLHNRTGGVARNVSARKLLHKIAEAAWKCADPGMQYDSTINKWHTAADTSRINASNPCSEYMFVDDSACNLASLNLVMFDTPQGFDVVAFQHAVRIIFIAQEILVDHASYPTMEIAANSHAFRPLGIGYANLGALLMRRGLPYDSAEGRGLAAAITALMTGTAYAVSAEMAAFKGPFEGYSSNSGSMLRVIEMHRNALKKIEAIGGKDMDIFRAAQKTWDKALVVGRESGFRNAQASLLAPTGTIGLLMDCDTTGIEPDYALVKHKKLAGGGSFDIVNKSVGRALTRLGYSAPHVTTILAHLEEHHTVEGCEQLREEHLPVFDCATLCGDGRRSIAPMGHVRMMAAVQPFLSGAISKTVNMPEDTTVEEIEELYVEGWRRGLKSLAIYRTNSKACQVLTGTKQKAATDTAPSRRRLPKKRLGFTQEAKIGGQKVYVRTGDYDDGDLGEVFIDMHKEGATMRSMTNCFAIAISLGLQHGVPLSEYVDAFVYSNFAPNGIVQDHPNIKFASSVIDYIMRLLAFEYLKRTDLVQVKPDWDETEASSSVAPPIASPRSPLVADAHVCTTCGMLTTRQNGNCYVCDNCGTQTGCA